MTRTDETLDAKIINRIIKCNLDSYTDDVDEKIDDFVGEYDSDKICRGEFKTLIWMLVDKAIKKLEQEKDEEIKDQVEITQKVSKDYDKEIKRLKDGSRSWVDAYMRNQEEIKELKTKLKEKDDE